MKRLSLPYYISRSGAKFEPTDSFLKSSVLTNTNEEHYKSTGIPIAQIDKDTYATTKEEMHCFVIGESGCGKTRRVVLPSIRLMAKTGESLVISDPKGELYRDTAYYLKKRGYDVKVLNFRNPRCGNRWNPLALVEDLYKSERVEDRDRAVMVLDDLISILTVGVLSQEDPFWGYSAANFFRAVALIILEKGESGELTFENISVTARKIFNAYSKKFGIRDSGEIKEFIGSLGEYSPIVQNLSAIMHNAEDTRNCILAMFETMISNYCNQELLLDLFSKSEIDLESIGKRSTALFFILPDDSDAMYPIATCFVKQVYSSLINLADMQEDGKLPNRVTFLLDEFANFAKIPTMHAMLTAARSRLIRFVLVCQSMDQLVEKYENSGMEILLSNCRVWLYMSCRNLPFLKRLEELAGNYTSPYTNETCPLVDIGTLQHFSMGQVLVFNDRCRPLLGYLDDYSCYDFGEEGSGVQEKLPAPHSLEKRVLFDIKKVCQQSNREGSAGETGVTDERSAFVDPDNVDVPQWAKKSTIVDAELLQLAQLYIQKINEPGGETVAHKRDLAEIIRNNHLDISALRADFDLSLPSLLKQGIDANDARSIVNLALYYIEKRRYDNALKLFKRLTLSGFKEVKARWYDVLWVHMSSTEGAFISILCYLMNVFSREEEAALKRENMCEKWLQKIKIESAYACFLADENVREWLLTTLSEGDE